MASKVYNGETGPLGDPDLKDILVYDKKFNRIFKMGLELYISGDWESAADCFNQCIQIREDLPTIKLLEYLTSYNLKSPDTWEGYKKLDEK